ncbi:hypothetical protein Gotur_003045 [Gossypium turneri]
MPVRVMIHQPVSSFYEVQTREFILEAKELLKLRKSLARVYAQRTGKLIWVVSKDMERDVSIMPTIKQLIRNARQPIKNVMKSPTLGGCP